MDKHQFFESLEEIVTDDLYIGNTIMEQEVEIKNNTWSISVNNDLSLDVNDFIMFFKRVIENRREQIRKIEMSIDTLFYAWADFQSGQIRFNVISDYGNGLPFGCNVQIVDSLESVIAEFLDFMFNKLSVDINNYVLQVYCIAL